MAKVVRSSRFRHVFGTAARRDACYDGLRITKSNWDGSMYCAVNPKFIAIIVESAGGGAFLVQPIEKTGRIERDVPMVNGHKGEVLDIKWCPHHDNVIASASADCSVKVWEIPADGLTQSLSDPIVDLIYHQRKVGLIEWHPTVSNILLSSGSDGVTCLWDVGTGEVLADFRTEPHIVTSISFNYNGEKVVTTCKDKITRVHNARTLEVLQEGQCHQGSKPSQAIFTKDDRVLTAGFSKMSDRQYALWDSAGENSIGNGNEPLAAEDIDKSNGCMFLFYDPDTSMVYLAAKGDTVIRYFEVISEEPYVCYLSSYNATVPQRGLGFMPKRGVNVNTCEIARFFKLVQASGNQAGLCEPISFTVPRKSELYQDDLYPDAFSGEPSLSADEWFTEGKSAAPQVMSLRSTFAGSGKQKAKVRASVLTSKKPAAASSAAPASSTPTEEQGISLRPKKDVPAVTVAAAPEPSEEMISLAAQVRELTATVSTYSERIATLESKLAEYENTVLSKSNDE